MSLVVFATSTAPAPSPGRVGPLNAVHTWTGWDGSSWQFKKANGIWLDAVGIRGMNMPPVTHYKRQPVSLNGSVWQGYIIPEREVFWPLHMAFTPELDAQFWRTMLPYKTGTWTVETPGGQARSLDLRFTDDSSQASDGSPFLLNHALYGITLAAEQPLWRGDPIIRSWSAPTQYLFFGGGSPSNPTDVANQYGPPFVPTQSSSYNDAQILNPSDVETWPKYAITAQDGAQVDSASVGLGADLIEIPFAIPAGQRLVIDSNPTVQRAFLGSYDPNDEDETSLTGTPVNVTADLGSVTWSMLPPAETVDVSFTSVGSPKALAMRADTLYMRAW